MPGVAGHGRYRRQMVGIKGVAQAEQNRNREGNQRLARCKRGDFLIEAEHSVGCIMIDRRLGELAGKLVE
ncbi:MAG TPA: hypothetical protein VKG82_04355 [Solirubrobacteraceae bacterium]|nr:hypothetical protein [Solirubrobacteraceae bacterium]